MLPRTNIVSDSLHPNRNPQLRERHVRQGKICQHYLVRSGQKLESFSSAQSTHCRRSAPGVYGGKQKDTWDPPRIAQTARLPSKLASLSRLDVSTIDCIRGSQLSLCFR